MRPWAITVVLSLAACQAGNLGPPSVSLEEAKKITAEFGGSFTPPPKSINDILSTITDLNLTPQRCENVPTFSDEGVRETMENYSGDPARFALGLAEREFHRGKFLRSVKYQRWGIDAMPSNWWVGRARNYATLAVYLVYAGDFAAADGALFRAVDYASGVRRDRYTGTQRGWDWYRFEFNLGRAAIAESKGDLIQGEATYRQALDEADQASLGGARPAFAKLALARNLTRQGRLLEAENTVREVLRYRLKYTTTTTIVATALVRLSEILYERGRYGEAEAVARSTIALYRILCAAPENLFLTTAQNVLGKSLVAQERWQEALAQYAAMRANMANDPGSFERMFAGNLYRALALLHGGRTAEAAGHLQAALERSRERLGDKHYNTAEIRGFLAMARLTEGDRQAALDEFAAATEILLKRSREADDESTTFAARDRRLNLILGSYIGLLADIRGTALAGDANIDVASEAFRLAEIARSRSVQRALSASGARAALTDPALAELARREQDTQKQVAALYGALAQALARPFHEQNRGMIRGLRDNIDDLRGARAALMEEIEGRFPDYAKLVNPRPPTLEAVRAALHPGEALISTYTSEDRTYVWAVPKSGPVEFAAVPLGRDGLARRVNLLRRALDPKARTLGEIPDFDLAAAHDLYAQLLAPVVAGWRHADTLLVVAHGALGSLPLAVLPTAAPKPSPEREPLFSRYRSVPWLVRSHAVTVLPSVSSLVAQRALPAGSPTRRPFAGFADPWFSEAQAREAAAEPRQASVALTGRGLLTVRGLPVTLRNLPRMAAFDSAELEKLPRLPDTAEEVRGIAIAMRADLTRDVFTGKAANEAQVKTMDLFGYRVIAFATHGLVPGDLDGLTQPALALSAPKVAGVEGDGLLTMGEILGLRLDADWVVLSACNTGAAEGKGAEAISGLGRAFFYAGARSLLVSNWPVETTSARLLTTDIFRRQSEDPSLRRGQALRRAMLGLMDGPGYVDDKGRTVFSYAHPIFWAPFSLVGDGGGSAPAGAAMFSRRTAAR